MELLIGGAGAVFVDEGSLFSLAWLDAGIVRPLSPMRAPWAESPNPQPSTPNPKAQILNPEPQAPKARTLNHQP